MTTTQVHPSSSFLELQLARFRGFCYTARALNRLLISIIVLLGFCVAKAEGLVCSPDGGLVSFGKFDYVYDSASRLTEVWSNDTRVVENKYDALGRRVIKRTPDATHIFVYDGSLLMVERIEWNNGMRDQFDYWWGKDFSGTLYDAGGVGGLLYIRKNGCDVYVPLYDGMGNVVQYVDKYGSLVAQYEYDAFGNTIQKSGAKADELKMRFSTKYFDDEAGLYYFGHRFYSPRIARWLTRDPIEEDGGINLYAYCGNSPLQCIDPLGLKIFVVKRLIGTMPPGGWGDKGRNHAQTMYEEPKIFLKEKKKGRGKIGFEVEIVPPLSIVTLFFRAGNDGMYPVLLQNEMQHVNLIRKYDEAIEDFKTEVEKIVDCPAKARRRLREAQRRLDLIKMRIVAADAALDAPGGPHGH